MYICYLNFNLVMQAYCSHSSSLALFRTKLGDVTLQHVFESSDASEISGPAKEDLLSVPARKIVFSSDGQFLAMTDCSHGVYIYSVDRYVCVCMYVFVCM